MRRTVWVGAIPAECASKEQLSSQQWFGRCGEVVSVELRLKAGPNKSWALLTFGNEEALRNALAPDFLASVTDKAGALIPLRVQRTHEERVLRSPLAGAMATFQFGVAYGVRRGGCTEHRWCMHYDSVLSTEHGQGGPCMHCKCYPTAHFNLGRFPTGCRSDGCSCKAFQSMHGAIGLCEVVSGGSGSGGGGGGGGESVSQASTPGSDRARVCGACGHSEHGHTAPFDNWEVGWDDITLLEELGRGESSRVHRCQLWNNTYAIKLLADQDTSSRTVTGFLQELALLTELRHPNIQELVAGVADTATRDDVRPGGGSGLAIITELASRGTLTDVLRREQAAAEVGVAGSARGLADWAEMALGVARGLRYLHTRTPQLVHRSLKPDNILVYANNVVRISDFGAMRSDHAAQGRELLKAGGRSACAYVHLFCPEYGTIRTGAHDGTTAVDVWAFGVLMWELMARTCAFNHCLSPEMEDALHSCGAGGQLLPALPDAAAENALVTAALEQLTALMQRCWLAAPGQRPTMQQAEDIVERAQEELEQAEAAASVDNSTAAILGSAAGRSQYVSTACREIDIESEVELQELIGAGTFGEVYSGTWHGTHVAVKRLHNQGGIAGHKEMLDEIRVEVQVLQTLHHPNIVMLMGMCTKTPWVSIVTEFMGKFKDLPDGSRICVNSIDKVLHETSIKVDASRLKAMLKEIVQGMAYLHGCKPPVVHRDLKPANLLVNRFMQVKIADFGLATPYSIEREPAHSHSPGPTLTSLGQATVQQAGGTPAYSAPEVLLPHGEGEGGKLRFDVKSDVFSFGVVLWEIMVRQRPWHNVHPARIMEAVAVQQERLVLPNEAELEARAAAMAGSGGKPLVGKVEAVRPILDQCFARDTGQRPTFADLLGQIETAL